MAEGKIIYCDELREGIVIGFKDNLIIVGTKKTKEKEESHSDCGTVTFG